MTETTWFMAILWIIFLLLGWKMKKQTFITAISGVIGLVLGLAAMSDVNNMIGLVIVFIGIYQMYIAVFEGR
jgi:small-conductance mechanosensitive channel